MRFAARRALVQTRSRPHSSPSRPALPTADRSGRRTIREGPSIALAARPRTRGWLTLLMVSLALLTIGGSTSEASSPAILLGATAPSVATAPTPHPTATALPTPSLPVWVPPGWQLYHNHHFAVAFPPSWVVVEHDIQDSDGQIVAAVVAFNSPDGSQAVAIDEHQSLDSDVTQQYCLQPGSRLTYAGLPMHTAVTSSTVRIFVFVARYDSRGDWPDSMVGSVQGVAYTLLYSQENLSQQVKWLYDSILATFHPDYLARACD